MPCRAFSPLLLSLALLVPACAFDGGEDGAGDGQGPPGGGTAERAVSTCFFTDSAIYCSQAPSWAESDHRVRVEDFYPSACADGDADHDEVPDFLDPDDVHDDDGKGGDDDDHGDDDGDDDHGYDAYRCPRCNRGPGNQNDFRLEVDGDEARLDRGKVYLVDGQDLIVPSPSGALTIRLGPGTDIEDGLPAPGAEIRVEGEMDAYGVIHAERLKVLCKAPAALPPDDVPPECEAVDPRGD